MKLLPLLLSLFSAEPALEMGNGRMHIIDHGVVTIASDPGGYVMNYVLDVAHMRELDTEVRIIGWCASSCTMYLGLENACTTPDSLFMFHGPFRMVQGQRFPLDDETFERISRRLAAHYPAPMAQWFMDESRFDGDHWVSGKHVIKLGAQECTS